MKSVTSRSLLTASLDTAMVRTSKPPPIGPNGDTGPWGWENAKAWKKQLPSLGALEIACYTDFPQLSFDINVDPFTFLTPLSNSDVLTQLSPGSPRMGLVVRVEQYLAPAHPDYYLDEDWNQTDPAVHHGGDAGQELAALLSLSLGIRVRAGGIVRVFHSSDGDPRGYPHEFEDRMPYLPQPYGPRVLPYTAWRRDVDTSKVELLGTYATLSSREARALVRSARAYQEALWIAESDPRQAWLRLVSAVEAIAQLAPDAPAASQLKAAFPDIADRVIGTGDPVLVEWITTRFAVQGRSTAKFLDFLLRFQPPPPLRRPAATYRVTWRRLRKQLNQIYDYRSKDLHRGIPFPEPLCQAPYISNSGIAREVAYVTEDWKGDPPILLHMFEYVVRSALLAWWRSTAR
jgi:hypothetical protein